MIHLQQTMTCNFTWRCFVYYKPSGPLRITAVSQDKNAVCSACHMSCNLSAIIQEAEYGSKTWQQKPDIENPDYSPQNPRNDYGCKTNV